MNFNSINTSQKPPFIAFPTTSDVLSDIELDQILNQPYEDAPSQTTPLPGSFDFPMNGIPLDFGPPPKLPLLPQFAHIETLKTQETKKRKKEEEAPSADSAMKKKKPATRKEGKINLNNDLYQRLINAIPHVVIYGKSWTRIAKEYDIPRSTFAYYIEHTKELFRPFTQNGKKHEHTHVTVVNAAFANCLKFVKEDPSLTLNLEKKSEKKPLRVEALLQAIKNKNSCITDDKLKNLGWNRKCFKQYAQNARRYAKDNTALPEKCISYIKEAVIKYRESSKSQD